MAVPARAGHDIRRLRGVERMYLALESTTTPMHFGALVVLDGGSLFDGDGRLRLADIRRRIADRVALVPEARRAIRPAGFLAGGPLWTEDPDFRIDRHVLQADLAPPGTADHVDETALLVFVEGLMAPLLDRSHPLWRMWCIAGLPDHRVALLFVVHHALADGLSAMRFARALLGEEPPAADLPSRDVGPSPRWSDLVIDNASGVAAAARRLLRTETWREVFDVARAFGAGWAATGRELPSPLNVPVGPRRRVEVVRLQHTAVKRVARDLGVGLNDVVLGLVAGGLRDLLAARGEALERMAPRAGIAVALPPSARVGDGGNQFGSYVVGLPVGEPDPVTRLRVIAAERERAKDTQSVTRMTGVRIWTSRLRPTRAMMARQRVVQVMETFLPGAPSPITLLGAPALDLVPIQPLGRNVGLTFLASTYSGCLTIVVRADPAAFPDLDLLLGAMQRDWHALA
jgi:WS/DGAT/MGAT family acyltransferase